MAGCFAVGLVLVIGVVVEVVIEIVVEVVVVEVVVVGGIFGGRFSKVGFSEVAFFRMSFGGRLGGRVDCRPMGLVMVIGCFVGWVVLGEVVVVLRCCGKEVGNGKRSQVYIPQKEPSPDRLIKNCCTAKINACPEKMTTIQREE